MMSLFSTLKMIHLVRHMFDNKKNLADDRDIRHKVKEMFFGEKMVEKVNKKNFIIDFFYNGWSSFFRVFYMRATHAWQ